VQIDPDATLGDLVGRLADDGKRLIGDEIRLAKLELGEGMRVGTRGVMWLALALAVAIVALVALTVFLSTVLGRLAGGNAWAGALITAVIEAAVGAWLLSRGLRAYRTPSYTLGESREELKRTKDWLSAERAG
jgi:uncharacterized membrane protein YqjE